MEKPELLPDVEEYLESIDFNLPVSIDNLEHIVGAIVAKTNLNEYDAKKVLRLFFQEIRNSILKKQKVNIRRLGSFYVSSPYTSNNSKKVFVKFEPKKSLIKKLNE